MSGTPSRPVVTSQLDEVVADGQIPVPRSAAGGAGPSVLRMRPMTDAEFEGHRQRDIAEYAEGKVRDGVWPVEGAVERSAAEFAELLPQGLASEDMLLFTGETLDGTAVGWVWLGLKAPSGNGEHAWVWNIEVFPEQRGRGYGRAMLAAAEAELVNRGVRAVGMNVFGANVVARRLYESAGYHPMQLQLLKSLD